MKHTVKAIVLFLAASTRWLLTSASSVESTCSSGDTNWNSGPDVSDNLRLWIESVKVKAGGGGENGGFAVNFYDEEQKRDEITMSS